MRTWLVPFLMIPLTLGCGDKAGKPLSRRRCGLWRQVRLAEDGNCYPIDDTATDEGTNVTVRKPTPTPTRTTMPIAMRTPMPPTDADADADADAVDADADADAVADTVPQTLRRRHRLR